MQMGFQGLRHDDESGLIYNRARMLDPASGRFIQRDPLGYPDGMNSYAAYHVMRGGVDPWGMLTFQAVGEGAQTVAYSSNAGNLQGAEDAPYHASAYLGVTILPSDGELAAARKAGGANIVSQRYVKWNVESCRGEFKGSGSDHTWHFDDIKFNDDGKMLFGQAYSGAGGPVELADKSQALAYISVIQFSSIGLANKAVKQTAVELAGGDREKYIEAFTALKPWANYCSKGSVEVEIEARLYVGNSWSINDFDNNRENGKWPSYSPDSIMGTSGAEFIHKPWTDNHPLKWRRVEPYSTAKLRIIVDWNACELDGSVDISVTGSSGGISPGPQREDKFGKREKNPNSTIWGDDNGGWSPVE